MLGWKLYQASKPGVVRSGRRVSEWIGRGLRSWARGRLGRALWGRKEREERQKINLSGVDCQALEEEHIIASENQLSKGSVAVPSLGKAISTFL